MVTVTLERIHDPVPQGTYRVLGVVDPPGTPLAAKLTTTDGVTADEPVTIEPDGIGFSIEAYLQQPGYNASVTILAPAGDPEEQAFQSDAFAVCRAIDIDAIHDVRLQGDAVAAEIVLRGYFRGEPWETAEWCEVTGGGSVEGAWSPLASLTHDQDGAGWFAERLFVEPGESLILRVRKAQNPGITTDSNPFNVFAAPVEPAAAEAEYLDPERLEPEGRGAHEGGHHGRGKHKRQKGSGTAHQDAR
jgi:hypothetical protein